MRTTDDPWAMVKLTSEIAKQNRAIATARNNKQAAEVAGEKLRRAGMNPDRFTAYKQSIDGAQSRRDYRYALTIEQVNALPLGTQQDHNGAYIWAYGINGGVIL